MSQYSTCNDFAESVLTDSVLNIHLTKKALNYAAYKVILDAVIKATTDPEVRALCIDVEAQHLVREDRGEIPARFNHRVPDGEHGAAPIVEQAVHAALFSCNKPTIALMNGSCESQSIDIASLCDIRLASESMTMQDVRIHTGEFASTGVTYMLPKLIGQSQAMRVLLLGEAMTANEAYRIQFLHRVFDDAVYESKTETFIRNVAAMATRSWEVHKLQVRGQMHLDFDSAMVHSLGIRQTHVINDRIEGIQAWRERRDPAFSGT